MQDLEELTTHCIRCGFCIESCPTFTVTGSEAESPRGRIYLVRSAVAGKLSWAEDVAPHLDLCLGCRACETACPSGVQYGEILELARDRIEKEAPKRNRSMLLKSTTSPGLLKLQLTAGKLLPGRRLPDPISKYFSGKPAEVDKPEPQKAPNFPPLDEAKLPPVKGRVYLLEGCAMRVLYPRVHACTRRLLRRIGYEVEETEQGCCGAMHAHNAHLDEARSFGQKLIQAMPKDLPVVVNSAGCGSTMKEYGELIGEDAKPFASRVSDLSQFLLANGLTDALKSAALSGRLTYHDACHLAHGQKVKSEPRELLKAIPEAEFVELPESDRCCGSAGVYNVLQPEMARTLLNQKWKNVQGTGAQWVATGNPGCHAWIAQAARETGSEIRVMHTAEVLEAAFIGMRYFAEGA